MNYTDFKNGLDNGKQFPIYLFEGEDAFFRERGLALLKNKFVQEPSLNYAVFNGEVSENDLLSSLSAFPFMSECRMTVIREYYPKQNSISKGIKEYFSNPIDNSILVIVNQKSCDVLKKLDNVALVECAKQGSGIIARYVKGKCAQQGVAIELETAKNLSEYCLNDMTRVENETDKLIAYAYSKKIITMQDVEDMVVKDTEIKIFKMTDYIGAKRFDLALQVVNDMLGKGETMQRILVALYSYFRRLLHVAISNKSDEELCKWLGVEKFVIKKLKTQAGAFKKKSIKNAVDILSDTDYLIKSGIVDADDRIWHNIFTIITA